jgi:hypothetical protein
MPPTAYVTMCFYQVSEALASSSAHGNCFSARATQGPPWFAFAQMAFLFIKTTGLEQVTELCKIVLLSFVGLKLGLS